MSEGESAVLAAVIAGFVTLIGTIITAFVGLRNEQTRRRGERRASERKEIRVEAAELFRQMFALQHNIEWITWHAKNGPDAFDPEMASQYDDAVNSIFSRLMGAAAVIAALDLDAYQRLRPLVDTLYNLDEQVALAAAGLSKGTTRERAVMELSTLYANARKLYGGLPERLASVMQALSPDAPTEIR